MLPYELSDSLAETQPIRRKRPVERPKPVRAPRKRPRRRRSPGCLLSLLLLLIIPVVLIAILLVLPFPINFVVMGIDRTPEGTVLGRSDTIMLISIQPLEPRVGMLSIPRDLWVQVPGVGENRINTAHFFAEGNQAGSGPQALLNTIEYNFHVSIPYYIRFQFNAFQAIVEAMDGVTIDLDKPTGGYSAGQHHLNGEQALAFVRDRAGSDDFFRMERGQIFIKAVIRRMLNPVTWPRLPQVMIAAFNNLDTNIPPWEWPRIAVAVLRTGIDGIDNRTINRDMVTPYTTNSGANVLLPRWEIIRPVVNEMLAPF
jgi:polyisoprenyl-teichoic acid--peptidoglycan teichoic acid transferase